ncbi:hypothetical protein V1514DRAFT_338600 [Lipomyces japonicus]|uniref:uncharacterized protein n=1 Tax=Lipomyces japonicus TaxID=56871 RepID=UPI0034CE9C1E
MTERGPGRVIFVGNIPYDQTEEQIMDVFQSVGPVVNFKFVFDKETGRPKGYGFVEYYDAETAASAVRNLNSYELSNRSLRVDFSHETSIGSNVTDKSQETLLPALPGGTAPPPNLSTPDAIALTIAAFTPQQMLSVLQELKSVVHTDPAKARELLKASPQLSYAVVQSMLLMGLIDAGAVAKALNPPQQQQVQQHQQQIRATSTPPPAAPRPTFHQATNTTTAGSLELPASLDPAKAALIKQVMGLTDGQIQGLPAEQRIAIEHLRTKILSGDFSSI